MGDDFCVVYIDDGIGYCVVENDGNVFVFEFWWLGDDFLVGEGFLIGFFVEIV